MPRTKDGGWLLDDSDQRVDWEKVGEELDKKKESASKSAEDIAEDPRGDHAV